MHFSCIHFSWKYYNDEYHARKELAFHMHCGREISNTSIDTICSYQRHVRQIHPTCQGYVVPVSGQEISRFRRVSFKINMPVYPFGSDNGKMIYVCHLIDPATGKPSTNQEKIRAHIIRTGGFEADFINSHVFVASHHISTYAHLIMAAISFFWSHLLLMMHLNCFGTITNFLLALIIPVYALNPLLRTHWHINSPYYFMARIKEE